MVKKQKRQEALGKRDCLNKNFRNQIANQLTNNVDVLLALNNANIIAGYWPIGSEIDPRPLMYALQKKGKTICLPVIIDKNAGKMEFRQYSSENLLIPMGFGTMGPRENLPILDPDLILLPLAAFDSKGNRIGYGKGFYDRAIAQMHKREKFSLRIGLAFDCQEVNSITIEDHDIPLNGILTENGLRLFR